MRDIHPLLAYTIIFLVSLFGAYIAFGILESTGTVKDERVQLGGAVAGFFIIFIAFSKIYGSEMDKIRKYEVGMVFNLSFPDKDAPSVNFENEKNGTYEIICDDQTIKKDDLKLTFNQPSGYIWKPPIQINPDSTIQLNLVEDDGKEWIVKEMLRTFTLYPRYIGIRNKAKTNDSSTLNRRDN